MHGWDFFLNVINNVIFTQQMSFKVTILVFSDKAWPFVARMIKSKKKEISS